MIILWFVCVILVQLRFAVGLGEPAIVTFAQAGHASLLKIGDKSSGTRILVASEEWPGVIRAAKNVATDFNSVLSTSNSQVVTYESNATTDSVNIIVATLGKSPLADSLIQRYFIDTSDVLGKWESFLTVPLNSTLLLLGSDKRATIFALYTLSSQIGVSPLSYWADVPPNPRSAIYALPERQVFASPSVKYRGIFLNDEQPGLTNWVNANFPRGKYGPGFGSAFYERVFEFLLRLKANLIWPAMWDSMFAVDDAQNLALADEMGIVVGTSHTEPLSRATKEWKVFGQGVWNWQQNRDRVTTFLEEGVRRAKTYETLWTVGMRGEHDTPMAADIETGVLEDVVAKQEAMLARYGHSGAPRSWCLYKEVQGYYELGMRVPNGVTLLWADDNWGNIRRLPTANERNRTGGAGVYYHFDYVGDPRNYKWLPTTLFQKTWQQMTSAFEANARQIWVVNVGDLKPLELHINHFMDLAYNITRWSSNQLDWLQNWATRDFGPDQAQDIASVAAEYSRISGRRKFELITPETWSLLNHREADRVLDEWKDLASKASMINKRLAESYRPAYFQLILFPILAGQNFQRAMIYSAKNKLYAIQGRNVANWYADEVRRAMQKDFDLTKQYHELLNGKWNHMMDQTHFGYTYWQQPMRQFSPPVSYVQTLEPSLSGAIRMSVEDSAAASPGDDKANNGPLTLPVLTAYSPARYFDVYNTGLTNMSFKITAPSSLSLSITAGTLSAEGEASSVSIRVSVAWNQVLESTNSTIFITVSSPDESSSDHRIVAPLVVPLVPQEFAGFVDSGGYVSIDFSKPLPLTLPTTYALLPGYGAITSSETPENEAFTIPLYLFASASSLILRFAPSLNTNPSYPLWFAYSVDGGDAKTIQLAHDGKPGELPDGWGDAVSWERWMKREEVSIEPGARSLSLWLGRGVVLKEVMVDTGGLGESVALGPPSSIWTGT